MDHERVSKRAYALWEQAGKPDGADDQHWQQACHEIKAQDGATMTDATSAAEMSPAATGHQPGEIEDQEHPPRPETTEQS